MSGGSGGLSVAGGGGQSSNVHGIVSPVRSPASIIRGGGVSSVAGDGGVGFHSASVGVGGGVF